MFYENHTPMPPSAGDPLKRVIEVGRLPVGGGLPFEARDRSQFNVWPELDPDLEITSELARWLNGGTFVDADGLPLPEDNRAEGWEPGDDWGDEPEEPPPEMVPAYCLLHFNLDGGEGEEQMKDAVNGRYYRSALQALDCWLRSKLKYEDLPEEVYVALEACRERIYIVTEDQGIPLFD
jgi:hypothetical protein